MAGEGAEDGIRIFSTVGSTIDGVNRQLAGMSYEGRGQGFEIRLFYCFTLLYLF